MTRAEEVGEELGQISSVELKVRLLLRGPVSRKNLILSLRLVLRLESPFTGISTPPSPEISRKSRKGRPAPPGPECQKSVEKCQRTQNDLKVVNLRRGIGVGVKGVTGSDAIVAQ